MGRHKKYIVSLTSDERKLLLELINKGKASKREIKSSSHFA